MPRKKKNTELVADIKVKEPISLGMPKIDPRLQARYDAALTSITNENHWSNADNLSPNQANNKMVRTKLVSRARYEIENNCILTGIVDAAAEAIVGTGCRLHVNTGNEKLDDEIPKIWADWQEATGLAEKVRLAQAAEIGDGESFPQFITNPRLTDVEVQLDVMLTETERVTSSFESLNQTDFDSINYVDGIRFDNIGNPISYHVLKSHPSEFGTFKANSGVEVSWENMCHLYRMRRIGQKRGVPQVTPALPLIALLRRYTLAVLETAETAANFSGVVRSTGTPEDGVAAVVPMETIELAKRMLLTLPEGWDISQLKAEQPTTQYGAFKNEIINEVARCILVPRNLATGDSSNYNYASGRLDGQQMEKAIEVRRSQLESKFYNRLIKYFLDELQVTRPRLRSARKTMTIDLFWDGEFHVDPQKEAKGQEQRLLNKTTTLKREFAKQGLDYRKEIAQQGIERKLLEKAGLSIGDIAEKNKQKEDSVVKSSKTETKKSTKSNKKVK